MVFLVNVGDGSFKLANGFFSSECLVAQDGAGDSSTRNYSCGRKLRLLGASVPLDPGRHLLICSSPYARESKSQKKLAENVNRSTT